MNPLASSATRLPQVNPTIMNMLRLLKSRNPDEVAQTLMNSNPQFRQFYTQNKGKSVQQICSENGIDYSTLSRLLK